MSSSGQGRSRSRRFLRWAALAGLLAGAGSACSKDEPAHGELIVALETDMSVPKDVTHIRLLARVDGVVKYQYDFPIAPDGTFIIPGTFAIVAGSKPGPTVGVDVVGMRKNAAGDSQARIFSRVITTIPRQRNALLRVPVQWLCDETAVPPEVAAGDVDHDSYSSTCEPVDGKETSCVAGACVPVEVPESSLPTYDPRLVFGGATGPNRGGECFDTVPCFAAGHDVKASDDCTLPVPDDLENFNVGFAFPPGTDGICKDDQPTAECYIPLEQSERFGWHVGPPPSGEPGSEVVVLPPAACEKVKGGKARSLRVTTACPTEVESMPTCGPWSSATKPAVSGDGGPGAGGASASGGAAGEAGSNGATGGTVNGSSGSGAGGSGGKGGGTGKGGASGSGGTTGTGGDTGVGGTGAVASVGGSTGVGAVGGTDASGGSAGESPAGAAGEAGSGGTGGTATGGSSGHATGGSGGAGTFQCTDPLVFPDANLEALVRKTLAIPSGPISKAAGDSLYNLFSTDTSNPVGDLTGVQCLSGLTNLTLFSPTLDDLTPLTGLLNLKTVEVSLSAISDLTALGSLTNLTLLALQNDAQVTDLSPLVSLTKLDQLFIDGTSVTSLTPISGLNLLTRLYMDDAPVTDLSPLAGLGLQALSFTDTPGLDLSPLQSISTLTQLSVSSSGYANLAGLVGLHLQQLGAESAGISDLSPLASMTTLTELQLYGNQITDVTPLASLTNLVHLRLPENPLVDISPLAPLTKLQNLELWNTSVTNVTALAGMTQLTHLELEDLSGLTDISPLAGLTALQYLNIGSTGVSDLTPISGLTNLQYLYAYGASVSDLTPLTDLTALSYLGIYNSSVTDLSPLVQNTGIGSGDTIDLSFLLNFDCTAQATNLAALRARGVTLTTECP